MNKLNLNKEPRPEWPEKVEICRPFLVKDEGQDVVVIATPSSAVIFRNVGITYLSHGIDSWFKNGYRFVRYLAADESVTVGGRND